MEVLFIKILIGVVLYFSIGVWLGNKVGKEACEVGCHEAYSGIMNGLTIFGWPVLYPLWVFKDKKEVRRKIPQ